MDTALRTIDTADVTPLMAAGASERTARYCVLPGFLSAAEQCEICASIGAPHLPEEGARTGRAVALAMATGAALPLPHYAALAAAARRAFGTFLSGQQPHTPCGAAVEPTDDASPSAAAAAALASVVTAQDRERVRAMASGAVPMTAAAMIYRAESAMKAHVDASVGRQPKWLVSFSFGLACDFVLGDVGASRRCVRLRAGDALEFDAATVLHGVERVLAEPEPGVEPEVEVDRGASRGVHSVNARCGEQVHLGAARVRCRAIRGAAMARRRGAVHERRFVRRHVR